jgi:5-hydroxyisourate hydrolase
MDRFALAARSRLSFGQDGAGPGAGSTRRLPPRSDEEARLSGTGRLTTHVLDTANGHPAAGVRIELARLEAGRRQPLAEATTNRDGRCDVPLLAGDAFSPGHYELTFHVGAYFRAQGTALGEPAFLDAVPVRFGVARGGEHYHVPLLISPYGYSTYRGS